MVLYQKTFSTVPMHSPNYMPCFRDIEVFTLIFFHSGFSYRNRTERIQNIHQMSITLQSRIQEEAKTIQGAV